MKVAKKSTAPYKIACPRSSGRSQAANAKASEVDESFSGDRVFMTMQAIIASPICFEYMVGYTSRPIRKRHAEHLRYDGYTMICVLDNGLEFAAALDLEMRIQSRIKSADKRSAIYRKYSPRARSDYNRRAGHKMGDNKQPTHTVYLVMR